MSKNEEETKRVQVNIGGRRFTVTTDQDENHVERLATIINDKLETSGIRSFNGVNEAILVALAIANDLVDEKDRFDGLRTRIREQSKQLLERMDMDRFRDIA